jgi:hypothetical protein
LYDLLLEGKGLTAYSMTKNDNYKQSYSTNTERFKFLVFLHMLTISAICGKRSWLLEASPLYYLNFKRVAMPN